jgi:hypothetical protein
VEVFVTATLRSPGLPGVGGILGLDLATCCGKDVVVVLVRHDVRPQRTQRPAT